MERTKVWNSWDALSVMGRSGLREHRLPGASLAIVGLTRDTNDLTGADVGG